MLDISVSEAKAMKIEAESQITRILSKLQANSGFKVEGVDVYVERTLNDSFLLAHITMQL